MIYCVILIINILRSNKMLNFLIATANGDGDGNGWMTWLLIGLLVVGVLAMVVFPMFNKNKKQKEADEGRKFLRPGDKIKTVGGIVGTIVQINNVSDTEKELVIETGINETKTTMTLDINALYVIMQRGNESLAAIEQARQEKEAADAARLVEKQAKKTGGNKSAGSYNTSVKPQPKVFEDTNADPSADSTKDE